MNILFFRTIFWLLILSIFVIILQHTIFSLQFFDNIKPELFTLIVLHYSFYENDKTRGYFLSSFVGFTEDVLTNQIFGINIFNNIPIISGTVTSINISIALFITEIF